MAVKKSIPTSPEMKHADDDGDSRRTPLNMSDVVGLQQRLQEEIARQQPATFPAQIPTDEPEVELHPAADRRQQSDDRRKPPKPPYSKIVKTLIGVAVVVVVGWMPVQRLIETSSVQAVVNATVVTVRSPINGIVGGAIGDLTVGRKIGAGNSLVTVDNPRADTNQVDHAAEMVSTLTADLTGIRQRIEGLEATRTQITERVETYRTDRQRRLVARLDEADARIVSAQAERDIIAGDLGRLTALVGKKFKAISEQDTMNLRLAAANARVDEMVAAKAVLLAEREALNAGRFLGDDYNDAPRSSQRVDDIGEMLTQLRGDETRLSLQLNDAKDLLAQEAVQLNPQRYASLDAPVGGRVWEVLSAPGEQVVAGQHLLSLVDCSKLIVTAAVSESVYNFLSLGWNVKFLMDGSKIELPGTVVQLSGIAAAASNFAIDPSALTREAYRVGIAVDTQKLGDACPVGRTGRVVFKKS